MCTFPATGIATVQIGNNLADVQQIISTPKLNKTFPWFLCTDMQAVFIGPRGEKGDDGEPGIPAKADRTKFERKALLCYVVLYFCTRMEKSYSQYFQNN